MKSLENIQELIKLLSESPKTHYNSVLHNFDFDAIDFKSFESWASEKYTRNCLYKDEQFELLLICWDAGQETSIHNHDGEDCWVCVLRGEMEEVFYSLDQSNGLKEEGSRFILPHQLSFMNDKIGLHKLVNSYQGKSVSLHVYAKPIKQCHFYCETSEQFISRKLNYDSVINSLDAHKSNSV